MTYPETYTDKGSGLPILFIHAFPLNSAMWMPQVEALHTQFRIITFDYPGFGNGGPALETCSMDACADMAVGLLDHLGIEKAVFCGLSMGGYILMAALRKYQDRMHAIIFSNTKANADSEEAKKTRLSQAEDVLINGIDGITAGLLPRLISDESRVQQPELDMVVMDIMRQATPEGIACMLRAMAARPGSFDVVRGLTIPTCVIVGKNDMITPQSDAEALADTIRNRILHVLPTSGHLSNLEQTERFNRIVADFCSTLSS